MAQRTGILDIAHAHRLATHRVIGNREHHERHPALVLLQHTLQFLQRHVALEGHLDLCVVGLVARDVDGLCLARLDMSLGGVEMRISRHHVTLFHEQREEHVLGSPSLMGGDDIGHAEDALHHGLELIERGGAGITLVAEHHLCPLTVAHCSGTTIGEQVDIHLVGF